MTEKEPSCRSHSPFIINSLWCSAISA